MNHATVGYGGTKSATYGYMTRDDTGTKYTKRRAKMIRCTGLCGSLQHKSQRHTKQFKWSYDDVLSVSRVIQDEDGSEMMQD